MEDVVRSWVSEGVGHLVLADTVEQNVLTRELVDGALAAHEALVGAGVRVAILSSEGPLFCGGGDFKVKRAPGVPPAGKALLSTMDSSPISWIAAVGAPVIGVGLHLVTTCLRVLIADDAWMSVPGWSEGRFPGPLSAELAEIVGPRRALHMAMTEERVSAEECVRIGLADRVVPAVELEKIANEDAAELNRADEQALAAAHAAWQTRLGTRHQ